MHGMPPLIQLDQAIFGHEDHPIVGPIDLAIDDGDKILLEGPSGSGKTSVLRGILGFLSLVRGRYLIHGEKAVPSAIWQLRQETGYITQELAVGGGQVSSWLSVQNVALREADLAQFSLSPSVTEQVLEDLSRGERQRLAIASTLARRPTLLLLDEITSALNEELRTLVVDHVVDLNAAVVVVSHDDAWRTSAAFRGYRLPS
jgi:ABC-type iron transport system FetAB ATPase subunit